MAVYGVSIYGAETYGYGAPAPAFRIDPFTSASTDYNTISLSWVQPSGTIQAYRLIRNSYGYPVDQDDGEILIDSLNYPGSQFQDATVVPGQYYYYGFYVATNLASFTWVRSAVTACLAIKNFGSYAEMFNLIPEYYISAVGTGDVVTANTQNPELQKFIQIFGWGMDLLRTQYNTYLNVNDPWKIPQSKLYSLATELGLNINPDIHPFTLRKAVFNNAVINQQRGTPQGIATEVSSLTGWNLDLQVGGNLMLNNDQSAFLDPTYPVWSQYLNYNTGERVTFTGVTNTYVYQCINATNIGNPPSGLATNNTWWNVVTNVQDDVDLANSLTGGINTWEVLYPAVSNGAPLANSIHELLGVPNPVLATDFTHNALQAVNHGSAQDVWLRSVSRTTADMATVTTTFASDRYQSVADGIPVPYTLPSQIWNAATTYKTGQIVTYNNMPFLALRQSQGAVPPYLTPGSATPEWTPLAFEPRMRLCLSAYVLGSAAVQVIPFCEWYDSSGNYITRIVARNPTPGTTTVPNNLMFDSFTTNVGGTISGRNTDDSTGGTWLQQAGTFTISPVNKGSVFPTVQGARTYAVINSGVSDTQIGVTLVTSPTGGMSQGLVFRWTDDTHYIRAGRINVRANNGGTLTPLGTYSTPFSDGDRMVIQLSGSSITVLRNGVSVLSTSSSFNQTATYHGIMVE